VGMAKFHATFPRAERASSLFSFSSAAASGAEREAAAARGREGTRAMAGTVFIALAFAWRRWLGRGHGPAR